MWIFRGNGERGTGEAGGGGSGMTVSSQRSVIRAMIGWAWEKSKNVIDHQREQRPSIMNANLICVLRCVEVLLGVGVPMLAGIKDSV